jgi:hypothetical protein
MDAPIHSAEHKSKHLGYTTGAAAALVILLISAFLVARVVGPATIIFMGSESGTWKDDPRNWERMFDQPQPAAIKVIHSKYWTSNHFTHEYICFLEFEANEQWKQAFIAQHGGTIRQKARPFQRSATDLTPDWFAPENGDEYKVWDTDAGVIYENTNSGRLHFVGVQL